MIMGGSVVIESRYNGPPGTANGGYSSGRFAIASGLVTQAAPAVEVTLRKPPPLGVELETRPVEGGTDIYRGGELVAQVRPATLADDEVIAPVGWDEAVAASAGYPGLRAHPFPTCFVCGPDRAEGDGLRLFSGRLPDRRTATPFAVPREPMGPELVWASLDCPGGWTVPLEGRPYVLGRIAVRILRPPAPGQRCVVMGALTSEAGRKAFTRTTLYGEDGALLALARSTWLALD